MRAVLWGALLAVTLSAWGGPASAEGIRATMLAAQARFEAGEYAEALKLYERANEEESEHAAAEYNIGLCHLHLPDHEEPAEDEEPPEEGEPAQDDRFTKNERKALEHFGIAASRSNVARQLRRDALYNTGLIKVRSADRQLERLRESAENGQAGVSLDDPANIDELTEIQETLRQAIRDLRESKKIEPLGDTEHNIRVAGLKYRTVRDLLRRARQTRQREDFLEDPRAHLEELASAQDAYISRTRLMAMVPLADPRQARAARRDVLRGQRSLMEHADRVAGYLSQFRESDPTRQPAPPATQPAEETPREKLYHLAAERIDAAVESQRDACAHLLDGEVKEANDKQLAAFGEMLAALYLFPCEVEPTLLASERDQTQLRQLVGRVASDENWLRDPLLVEHRIPEDAEWPAEKTAIYHRQQLILTRLLVLRHMFEYLASASQPAGEPPTQAGAENPLLEPEVNAKLAEALGELEEVGSVCLEAIVGRDKPGTLRAQKQLLEMIDQAMELIPRSIEWRIEDLIVRQARLNREVRVEVDAQADDADAGDAATSSLDRARKFAARVKDRLLRASPGQKAEMLRKRQEEIRTDTDSVKEEVREQIPADDGTSSAVTPPSAGPASQPASTGQPSPQQAYIHMEEASLQMSAAIEGLNKVIIRDSLAPLEAGGPVPTAQAEALAALERALEALRPPPPQTQPSDDDQQEQEKRKQAPKPQPQMVNDAQRESERMDDERERAKAQLRKHRPPVVIKDW